ncbi:MAG: polysaccharide biosynthesis protein [Lachnospiraceae bacterium]|nr:polysaccharide biosynthesis protein [Lachnospiraceae bacterium]
MNTVSFLLVLYDIIAVNLAYLIALWLRFDCQYNSIPVKYLEPAFQIMPLHTIVMLAVLAFLRLYQSVWRYASLPELIRILWASLIGAATQIVGTLLFLKRMPISYYFMGWMLMFCALAVSRFGYRAMHMIYRGKNKGNHKGKNVMIIGAGEAGKQLLDEMLRSRHLSAQVKCFIDDDVAKQGKYISDIPIVGGRMEILAAAHKYEINQIILAIPSLTTKERRDILSICKETGCELMSVPGIYQLVTGEVSVSSLKKVSVEDLLGREPIKVNIDEILGYVQDKVILVTGGGGSIGSELCRQIAAHDPKKLIIFDIYENNAYEIEQELKRKYPELDLLTLIGSVRDVKRINQVFEKYQPQIVYHAAAHKHVPLMETSPNESIKNNVIGTYKTALAAKKNGCERFVLISTDKAVNPTNIMGASKRLCEMVVQTLDRVGKLQAAGADIQEPVLGVHAETLKSTKQITGKKPTEFVAVRFGNVLGSNGSVIPLFKKQIEVGGPVTVTHPDIIRYFMTIPEAVSLVLQAGAYAKGGEIFILDMGDPVKIDDLARNLIKLSGLVPDVDIDVKYTGLRPGEKLYEEKLMAEEGMQKTANELIHIAKPIEMDVEKFFKDIQNLYKLCYDNVENIREAVVDMVDTYHYKNN